MPEQLDQGSVFPNLQQPNTPAPLPATPTPALARCKKWFIKHPSWGAVICLGILFGVHLYTNRYHNNHYDSQGYWELANTYWSTGRFELLSFDSILRGYLFPLLLSPFTLLTAYLGWEPINITRAVGLSSAVVLFGVVGPGLWRTLQGPLAPAVPLGRRLVFGLLGFLLWRDYFNFSITDFLALLALLYSVWTLQRNRSILSGLLAGIALAAAVNFRPVYAAALPLAALLCLWPQPTIPGQPAHSLRMWVRRAAYVVGIALTWYPQLLINQVQFGVNSPLVITAKTDGPSLYLYQLEGGLRFQKYETNVGSDYPRPQMLFDDPQGVNLARQADLGTVTSYEQYLHGVLQYPIELAGVIGRHFFNGLDLQYPSLYINKVYVRSWPMALLNYLVLLLGFFLLLRLCRQHLSRHALPTVITVLTILSPCVAALPIIMECRFLMPLHLLLCAVVAFETQPALLWQRATVINRTLFLAAYAGLLVGCFAISMNSQLQLQLQPRRLFEWQAKPLQPW